MRGRVRQRIRTLRRSQANKTYTASRQHVHAPLRLATLPFLSRQSSHIFQPIENPPRSPSTYHTRQHIPSKLHTRLLSISGSPRISHTSHPIPFHPRPQLTCPCIPPLPCFLYPSILHNTQPPQACSEVRRPNQFPPSLDRPADASQPQVSSFVASSQGILSLVIDIAGR